MNIADIILLLILLTCGVVNGLKQGIVAQLASLVALYASVLLSCRFANEASAFLAEWIQASPQVLAIVSFVLLFIVIYFAIYLVGLLIKKIVTITIGSWVDKLLGVVFALFKVTLILGVLILLFDAVNTAFGFFAQDKLNQSVVYVYVKRFTDAVFPFLKSLITWQK